MRRTLAITATIVGLSFALTGCSSSTSVHGTVLLQGAATVWDTHQLDIVGGSLPKAGDSCWPMGDYTAIASGAEVDITDASSKVVGVGHLQAGKVEFGLTGKDTLGCALAFTVDSVPTGGDIYGVRVGTQSPVHVSGDQLAKGPLVTIGSGITRVN
jgi:hypothetical protein